MNYDPKKYGITFHNSSLPPFDATSYMDYISSLMKSMFEPNYTLSSLAERAAPKGYTDVLRELETFEREHIDAPLENALFITFHRERMRLWHVVGDKKSIDFPKGFFNPANTGPGQRFFTHNHPAPTGGPLSATDIKTAVIANYRELRSTARDDAGHIFRSILDSPVDGWCVPDTEKVWNSEGVSPRVLTAQTRCEDLRQLHAAYRTLWKEFAPKVGGTYREETEKGETP